MEWREKKKRKKKKEVGYIINFSLGKANVLVCVLACVNIYIYIL